MQAAETDVAIVGAGVAGGAAACALAGHGLAVTVFERRDVGRDPNRGDALHPQTLPYLQRWGAREALEARHPVLVRRFRLADSTGRTRTTLELGDHPLLVLNHADIQLGLLEVAQSRGARLRPTGVGSVRRRNGRWHLETAEGVTAARLVVGADGERSLVRRAAGIGSARKDYAEALVIMHAATPGGLPADTGLAVIAPQGGVLLVPTTPAGRCRIVALVRRPDVRAWLSAGAGELAERLGARMPWLPPLDVWRDGGVHVYRLSRQHAERYVRPGVALVGDAAHVTHPNGGQGMNLAIQDAGALADAVLPVLLGRGGHLALWQALSTYEARRRPINRRAMRLAHAAAVLERPTPARYWLARAMLVAAASMPGVAGRLAGRFGGGVTT